MKPIFTCKANGNDITRVLADRLIGLRVTDEAGFRSDRAEFKLDNRDNSLSVPTKQTLLSITLGYENRETVFTGTYTVDEVELSGPPRQLTIRSKAANMRKMLKAPRSQSWHGLTIGEIVQEIAGNNLYKALVKEPLASVLISHIDQTEESDMHFLTRLALEHGAIFKPANGFLLFREKDDPKTFSGLIKPPVILDVADMLNWRYSSIDRSRYQAVRARWRDTAANADVFVTAGSGDPAYTLRHSYADADQAAAAARAKLAALARGAATLEVTVSGLPGASAETALRVAGLHPAVDTAEWVMNKVTHEMTAAGFVTSINAEVKKR